MNTLESLNGMTSELMRRGLPADYAQRAACELADHHRDLVDELQAGGMNDSEVTTEASRRLGNSQTLVKKTVREYQRRYWCGRWPLITFLLAPVPALIAAWTATAFAVFLVVYVLTKLGLTGINDPDVAFSILPVGVKYAVLIGLSLVIPAFVLYAFARLAKRAALGWQWVVLVACILGLFASMMKWERIGPGSRITMRDWQTLQPLEQPQQPDFVIVMMLPIHSQSWSWSEMRGFWLSNPVQACQLLLPAAVAVVFLLRGRQLALDTARLAVDGC